VHLIVTLPHTAPDDNTASDGWPAEAIAKLTADGERATRLVMRVTGAPLAWVELLDEEGSHILAQHGLSSESGQRKLDLAQLPRAEPIVVESNTGFTELSEGEPPQTTWVMAKLYTGDGVLGGVLAVADVQPRAWSQAELADIADVAAMLSRCITAELERARHNRLETRHRDLLNLINIGPTVIFRWEFSTEWRISYASENLQNYFGYMPEEITSGRIAYRSMVHPDDIERVTQEVQNYLQAGIDTFHQHYRLRHADGTYRYVDDYTLLIRDAEGAPQYYYGYLHDVTERREAEAAFYQSNARLASILDSDTAYIARTDIEGRFTFVNQHFVDLIRRSYPSWKDSLIGKDSLETIIEEDRSMALAIVIRCIEQPGKPFQVILRKPNPEDGYFHTLWEFVGLVDQEGTVYEIQCVGFDITRLMTMTEELSRKEELYRFVFDNTNDSISLYNGLNELALTNDPPHIDFGLTVSERMGMDEASRVLIVHPSDLDRIMAEREEYLARRQEDATYIYRLRRRDGRYMWVENRSRYVYNDDGSVRNTITVRRDITQAQEAQIALRINEERYRTLTRMMSDFVFEGSFDERDKLRIRWLEGNYESVTGYPIETAAETWQNAVVEHPDDVAVVKADLQRTAAGECTSTEFRIRHQQGHYVWVRSTRLPIIDPSTGRVTSFYGVVQNIDAAKNAAALRAEQERLSANLRHEEALNETIRRVVSAISHDVRTPLAVISTSKEMLSHYYDRLSEERRAAAFDTIDKQLSYVTKMLDDLGKIVKGTLIEGKLQLSAVNIKTLCHVMITELQQSIGQKHRLLFEAEWHQGPVMIDETLVQRILLNLLSNAIKFSPQGSQITLRLAQDHRRIILQVSDQGIGIPLEAQEQIFEMFYRADNALGIEGTGLGLSIVKECVERHAGRITVESLVSRGTTFTVELPLLIEQIQRSIDLRD
jgi:PAS domain S-box-containing protein